MKNKQVFWYTFLGFYAVLLVVGALTAEARTDVQSFTGILSNDIFCESEGGNGTDCYRQSFTVGYDASELNSVGSDPLQAYFSYSCDDIGRYNEVNSAYTSVEKVVLRSVHNQRFSAVNSSDVTQTFYISNSTPFSDFKLFHRLDDAEGVTYIIDTFFNGSVVSGSPCYGQVVLGTKGCDRCIELQFARFEQDVIEYNTLQAFNDNIKDKIRQVFRINFEFFVIAYWVVLLAILLGVVTLLFWMVFFVYHFLKHFLEGVVKRGKRR